MSLIQLHQKSFIYIKYHREDFRDFIKFKGTLLSLDNDSSLEKDIIIDVLPNDSLTQWELSVLSIIIKRMEGTSQQLRVFANRLVIMKIESNHQPIPVNVSFFNNVHSLLEKVTVNSNVC